MSLAVAPRRVAAVPGGRAVSRRHGVALALLAGVAWAGAAPPRGWWPLLPLGVAALTVALRGRRVRDRMLFGGLTGATLYGSILWWVTGFSAPGYVVLVMLEASLLALAAALVPATVAGRWAGGWWALPAALVLLEAAQSRFPLGGFPLPGLALSQVDGPFAGAAPWGGSLLVTAAAASAGVAVASLLSRPDRRGATIAAAVIAVSALPWTLTAASDPVATLDAVVIQGGGVRGVPAVYTDATQVTDRHLDVLRELDGSPDLVLLPENVVDVQGPVAGSLPDRQIAAQAQRLQATVVAGVVEKQAATFRNAALAWDPTGTLIDRYEKEHRVPFGEYLPARPLLERLSEATALVPRDAVPGDGQALLRTPAGPLGVVISYEVFFADRVREAVTAGGQVILVPTNATSYVTEEVPALEVAASRLRAREFHRAVLQAAPTGYSVIVTPDGAIEQQSELGATAVLRAVVPLHTDLTPYARLGDLPVLALALAALAAGPVWARRTRAAPHEKPALRP